MLLSKKASFFLLTMGIVASLNAQQYDSLILGRWVTIESVFRPEIENSSLAAYMQYHFDHNNIVSYGTSQYELGHQSEYRISGNRLNMYNTTYSIESSSPEELTLTGTNHLNQSYRISLIRKEVYDDAWRRHNPSLKTSPYTFTANFSLFDYVFSFTSTPEEFDQNLILHYQNQQPPRYDEYLTIKVLFDNKGKVQVADLNGIPMPSGSNLTKLKRRIENTSGHWIKRDTEFQKDTIQLTFLKPGKSSLDFRNKAFNHFQRAIEYFSKEDYLEGLNSVNKAITLQDKNFQFYILRSLFYLKEGNLDKYCGDIVKAHELNPLITLTQEEIVEGEKVEIKCGIK